MGVWGRHVSEGAPRYEAEARRVLDVKSSGGGKTPPSFNVRHHFNSVTDSSSTAVGGVKGHFTKQN